MLLQDTEGLAVPDWVNVLYPYPLGNLVSKQYIATFAGNQEVIRLVVGKASLILSILNPSLLFKNQPSLSNILPTLSVINRPHNKFYYCPNTDLFLAFLPS